MECPKCGSNETYFNGCTRLRKEDKKYTKSLYCKSCNRSSTIELNNADIEIIQENVRFKKEKQRFQDINRIERKAFRENARIENAIEEFEKSILEQIKEHAKYLSRLRLPKIIETESGYCGVIHITDWHGNELINLPHNKYDFNILSRRAQKLANEAIKIFSIYGINSILIACTGDMLNSDRRLDELLNQSTNRAKATLLMVHILKQFILHLRTYFTINIVSVLGNESRANKDMHFHNNVISDNYDYTIFAILKQMFDFAGIQNINFGSIDKMEEIVNINGQNWLLKHDYSKGTNKQKDVQSTIGRYSLAGHKIDFILGGHTHATRITDISSRASSMPGSNEYNENALDLFGRSAQPIYIVGKQDRISINIDLQNTDNIDGYHVVDKLAEYNAKSHDKTINKETILKITI